MDWRAVGAFYESQTERHPLGRFHGHDLTALVRHRRLRFAWGERRVFRFDLGSVRPDTIEVTTTTSPDAPAQQIDVPSPPDPRATVARRTAMLWAASLLVLWAARRIRRSGDG